MVVMMLVSLMVVVVLVMLACFTFLGLVFAV